MTTHMVTMRGHRRWQGRAAATGVLIALVCAPVVLDANGPRAHIETSFLALGTVARGTPAEGTVLLRNRGSANLRVTAARASSGIVVAGLPADVPPGGAAEFRLAVLTDDLDGLWRGQLVLAFNDPLLPEAAVTIACRIADPIEVIPRTGFALTVLRGEVQEAVVEVVNRERAPLRLGPVEHVPDGLDLQRDVLEPGQRYRLRLAVRGDGPAGTVTDTIAVGTSSARMPLLQIPVRATVRERVRVSPASLNLGTIRLSDPANGSRVEIATLVVTRRGSDDFFVTIDADLPALDIATKRASGDRWHGSVAVNRDLLHPGQILGHIFVHTSDPDYPLVSVPVVGEVVAR